MRLEFIEGTSKKFWEANVDGSALIVRWGRIGTSGQEKKYPFKNPREAREEHDALVAEKLKKGYRRSDVVPAAQRNDQLEAAMFESSEPGPTLVYADWLQSNGNEWGELITIQHALEKKPKDKAMRKREKELLAKLPMPSKEFITLTWKRGCIDTLHVFNEADWMDESHDVMVQLRPLLELPHAGGLSELRTGVIRWDGNTDDVPAVIAEAGKHPFSKRMTRLFLGDIASNVDMDHHTIGDVRALSKAFPALTWLKLHSGAASWSGPNNFEFGPLVLPNLETLIIETCGLTKKRVKQLLESKLPSLTSLEVWFGAPDYGANATLKDLTPLLTGKLFPKLTRLGLRNLTFTNELVSALIKSPLRERVEQLDLSMGTLDAKGVKTLCENANAFPKLTSLDVTQSFLVEADAKALKKAFGKVKVNSGDDKKGWDSDPDARYVSIHE